METKVKICQNFLNFLASKANDNGIISYILGQLHEYL